MSLARGLAVGTLLLCLSGTAFAHAHLRTASPAIGSTTQTAPTEVGLNFTEALEPQFSTIEVQDDHGQRVDTGDPHLAPGNPKHFSIALKPLAPGTYTVIWHATSVDSHKTDGRFRFTVAP